ncbi:MULTISPECIES: ATP-binding cassette domain-containing protein [Methylosinus]|uniref:ABC transporter ATP-binding protein n=1 Tax=Methylosinus trichosporium (strain ATCC 35070 / NCIMB 11131 / UNIQEM 75 / OB3b) TaxID=595536 RepID=A0A2D2D7P1_METT3|nr:MULTISPECIES: ATP-binding cassette domain-containing protein [Methylosinus]ATQ70974.1 ABC transporter ATP-binding protein [Methylosinus trichosporium OB3b]OBS53334.1 multidrug ABC transporter ATP-binding protein [Methylosinus sp. 3S-1]
MTEPLVSIENLSKRFAAAGPPALDALSISIAGGRVTGLVGPDGAGKTTLMRLMAGLLTPSDGRIEVCGFDVDAETASVRDAIGYMPQRFGLYEDLTVGENLTLYADLRGVVGPARRDTFDRLLAFTDLARFVDRRAGALSGGMKQKLGLACAMLNAPSLLLLDEPSVGVDPISRRELWRMVYALVEDGVAVVWSTAYLDEAENCAEVVVLDAGRVLYQGDPKAMTAGAAGRAYHILGAADERRTFLAQAIARPEVIDGVVQGDAIRLVLREGAAAPAAADFGRADLSIEPVTPRFEDAYVALLGGLPKRTTTIDAPPRPAADGSSPVEARELTRRFGAFVAADRISFRIARGEIFGLLGPNGAGKSTTFKMMCGLLRPSEGKALVDGLDLDKAPAAARSRLGYMAQKFSLYGDLGVRQNLEFFAGVYGLTAAKRREAIERVAAAFDLEPHFHASAGLLPLGFKQRLALACAVMHQPSVLFLDEPTAGVDPLTRREFWGFINAMVAQGVTVMVTTHFMDEAEYCDRIALIYRGKSIAVDTPKALQARVRSEALPNPTLEDAFIGLVKAHDAAAA